MPADIESTNHGTIIELRAVSRAGHRFMRRLSTEPWQRSRDAVPCEPRYAIDIMHAALERGLAIRDSRSGRVARS